MLSEDEVQSAAANWRAVADAIQSGALFKGEPDQEYQRGLSEGYASALEMVLKGSQK
jgi:hypothetical protein